MWAEAQQTAFNELKCAITSLDTTRKKKPSYCAGAWSRETVHVFTGLDCSKFSFRIGYPAPLAEQLFTCNNYCPFPRNVGCTPSFNVCSRIQCLCLPKITMLNKLNLNCCTIDHVQNGLILPCRAMAHTPGSQLAR
jgi:hypothetical protein